jgi:hypothetical protein
MPSGRQSIKYDGKPFVKGDTRINRGGRPKKSYSAIIQSMKALGYEAPTVTEFHEVLGLLFVMNEADMKQMQDDESTPQWVRLTIAELNNKNTRHRVMADHRDWLFGRAKQSIDHTTAGEAIRPQIDLSRLTEDELRTIANLQRKAGTGTP